MVTKTQIYFATRKTANAHVYITKPMKGREGSVRVNNVPIDLVEPTVAREVILAPLELAVEHRNKINISVKVSGGGFMGQSYAAATAITRALIGWTKSKKEPREHPLTKSQRADLKDKINAFDKYLISGDARRKEPKKFGGPGARRRKQKSYR